MERSRTALLYLLPSLLLLAVCAAVILFAWYPHPFRQWSRPGEMAALLILAACLAGPALAWLVATPGKSRTKLVFDLVFIGLVQLAATAWGMYNLSLQKPYFMVFTLDRFDVLARGEVTDPITNPAFIDKPLDGPVLLYANMPTETAIRQRLLREVMFEGRPDLQNRPAFWSVYDTRRREVARVARPLVELRAARPEDVAEIDALVRRSGNDITRLRFVPAMMEDGEFSVVVAAGSGELLGYLDTDPWLY